MVGILSLLFNWIYGNDELLLKFKIDNYNDFFENSPSQKTIEPQGIERGRTLTRISSISKYGGGAQAASNFRGRKSNSLMNLCGGKNYPNFNKFNYLCLSSFLFSGLYRL